MRLILAAALIALAAGSASTADKGLPAHDDANAETPKPVALFRPQVTPLPTLASDAKEAALAELAEMGKNAARENRAPESGTPAGLGASFAQTATRPSQDPAIILPLSAHVPKSIELRLVQIAPAPQAAQPASAPSATAGPSPEASEPLGLEDILVYLSIIPILGVVGYFVLRRART